MKFQFLFYCLGLLAYIGCQTPTSDTSSVSSEKKQHIKKRLDFLSEKAILDLEKIPLDSMSIPRTVEEGVLKGTKSKSWTSGFHHDHLWDFPVIIDNMMNLEMLFEATKLTGDSSFYHVADQHAKTTLKNHFRPDNSSYHVISYNPKTGAVEKKNTHQGFSHESAWSRGQAWGLYGFTAAYRYTKNPAYLEQAKKIAEYIFTHPNLPADLIPYWDYNAPNIPDEPRDVSAATVTASGLFELSEHDQANADKYVNWANQILTSLESETYQLDTPPFFLKHSVGSIPGEFEMDAPIIYADYYYVEALLRSYK